MTQQIINVGTGPNSATGDPIRTAFQKVNANFTDLYTGAGGPGTGTVTSVAITSTTLTVTGSPITGSGTITINAAPASVSNSSLANMPAISVKANPGSAPGQPQDFVASGANQVLQVNASGTGLQWGPFGTGVQVRGVTYSGGSGPVTLSSAVDVSILNPTDSLIQRVTILTKGGTGSCQLDVWSSPIGSYPPTAANTIFTVLPTITSGISYDDTVLSGLSTNHIPTGNVLTFHLVSTNGVFTEIILNLAMVPTQSIVSTGYTDAQAVAAVKAAMSNSGNVVTTGATGVITQNYVPPSGGTVVAGNGYITLGSGASLVILRWGTFTLPASSQTNVTFPVAFPNNCFACVPSQGDSASYGYPFGVDSLTRTGFIAVNSAGGINAGTGYYIAIGN